MTNALQTINGQQTAAVVLPVPIEAMRNLLSQRKDLIVKIGNTFEISRPLALELYRLLVEEVLRHGGSIKEETRVEVANTDMAVVVVSVHIRIGESELSFSEVGEAYSSEKGKETSMVRTAYTRAMKRLLERVVGEDFINRFILSLPEAKPKEAPASAKQKELIRKLYTEKRLTAEIIQSLKEDGTLPADFTLKASLEDNTLTSSQASAIIARVLNGN